MFFTVLMGPDTKSGSRACANYYVDALHGSAFVRSWAHSSVVEFSSPKGATEVRILVDPHYLRNFFTRDFVLLFVDFSSGLSQ